MITTKSRMSKTSMILTINTKDPETIVIFGQPLCSISEIQLVDYDFPVTYETFEADQKIKKSDRSRSLLSISASNYSFKMLQTAFVFNNSGVEIHPTSKGYHIISKNEDVIISSELCKKLNVPNYLPAKKFYPISWPSYKYHVYCDIGASSSMLGQITTTTATKDLKLAPTNLLAIIPSKSTSYPSIPIQTENLPINYLTLSLLDENGNKPNFSGVPFRISLRVTY